MFNFQEHEDKVHLAIGMIIRRWSRIDQWVWSEIGSLQQRIYMRHAGLPRALYPDRIRSARISQSDFRRPAGNRSLTRFRYLQRLTKALLHDPVLDGQIDALLTRATALYETGNDIAHASIDIDYTDGTLSLRNQAWADKGHVEWNEKRDEKTEFKDERARIAYYKSHENWLRRN